MPKPANSALVKTVQNLLHIESFIFLGCRTMSLGDYVQHFETARWSHLQGQNAPFEPHCLKASGTNHPVMWHHIP